MHLMQIERIHTKRSTFERRTNLPIAHDEGFGGRQGEREIENLFSSGLKLVNKGAEVMGNDYDGVM